MVERILHGKNNSIRSAVLTQCRLLHITGSPLITAPARRHTCNKAPGSLLSFPRMKNHSNVARIFVCMAGRWVQVIFGYYWLDHPLQGIALRGHPLRTSTKLRNFHLPLPMSTYVHCGQASLHLVDVHYIRLHFNTVSLSSDTCSNSNIDLLLFLTQPFF